MQGTELVLPRASVHLHGALKRKFGGPYLLGVQTPMEAIRALTRMKGHAFQDAIRDGDWKMVRGPRHGGIDIDLPMIDFKLGDGGALHIIPAAHGRGGGRGGSTGKIIAGVALVALAVVTGGAAVGAYGGLVGVGAAGGATFAGISASSIGMMGVGMIFSGAASLLSPQPKTARPVEREAVAANPSFLFDGPGMVMEQGRIVPLIYGYNVRVGGVLVSSSYDTIDVDAEGNAIAIPNGTPAGDAWKLEKGHV